MKDKIPHILSIVFISLSAYFGYVLYKKVTNEDAKQKLILTQEEDIKKKLTLYGQILKIYINQQTGAIKSYPKDWYEIKEFVLHGKLYEIERKEIVKELYLGKDTTIFKYDTLKTISIMDSIWNKSGFEIRTFSYVPDIENAREFVYKTGYTDGKAVFEITDPEPIHPSRQSGELDTLRVGSMKEATTEGNWR
jgi:predicted choloylglycine hydrolase